jgi:hypothetical protein
LGKKKGKTKKIHARHLVWLWLPLGEKKRKSKNFTHTGWSTPSGLVVVAIGPKKRKNKKCHACCLVRPWSSSAKKIENTKNVMHTIWSGHGWSCMPYGLAMIALPPGQNKKENKKCHAHRLVCLWPSSAKKKKKGKASRTPSGLALIANGPKF